MPDNFYENPEANYMRKFFHNTKRDISIRPDDFYENQKANYMRFVKFFHNTKRFDEKMCAIITGYWIKEGESLAHLGIRVVEKVPSDIVLKQYDVYVFNKLKFTILGIMHACLMYGLPIELMHMICQCILYWHY